MKAIRITGDIIWCGEDKLAPAAKEVMVKYHKYLAGMGAWKALFHPEKSIEVVDLFDATGQFYYELDSFWLWVENDKAAWFDFVSRAEKIRASRKTLAGIENLCFYQAEVFRRKWWMNFHRVGGCEIYYASAMRKSWIGIFTDNVTEHKYPEIMSGARKPADSFWEFKQALKECSNTEHFGL